MVVDHLRDRFGVEPVCRVLDLCPGTYYGRKRRPPSPCAQRDAVLIEQIRDVHQAYYGARRVHRQLRRQGVQGQLTTRPRPQPIWSTATSNWGTFLAGRWKSSPSRSRNGPA
ncbi:IS3 family transposase [Actinomadura sp. 9N407]|uniref:IS3 family transposase n=1 Tax=Actinomadura sp. 9N407 TaxID=3375154 RepID=UPI003787858C